MAPRHRDRLTQEDILTHLTRVEIFHDLSQGELTALLPSVRCKLYSRRELIYSPGRQQGTAIVIATGAARLFRESAAGKELTIAHLHADDICGIPLLVDPALRPMSFLQATVSDTLALFLCCDSLREFIVLHPEFNSRINQVLARLLVTQVDRIEELAFFDVETRLAHELAREARLIGRKEVVATNQELGWQIGASQEETWRRLHHLEALGLVELHPLRHEIRILQPDQLERFPEG